MDFSAVKTFFERLKNTTGIYAFGLILFGVILVISNNSIRTLSGVLGLILIAVGTLMVVVSFIISLLDEARAEVATLYKGPLGAWRNMAKQFSDLDTAGKSRKKEIGGPKKSYTSIVSGGETESE